MQNRIRLRQKVSRKLIIVLGISFISVLATGLTLYFNFTNLSDTQARNTMHPKELIIQDLPPVNDFSIPAPVLVPQVKCDSKTTYIRKIKTEQSKADPR